MVAFTRNLVPVFLVLAFVACGEIRTDPSVGEGEAGVDGTTPPADSGEGVGGGGSDGSPPAGDAGDAGRIAKPDAGGCTPSCGGRECGPDGCGGSCGSCFGANATCTFDGKCQCNHFCGSRVCGDDGCGTSCGTCPPPYTCVVNGTCQKDPGSACGSAVCGSAASCCQCKGQPICFALPAGSTCESLGAGCS